MTLPWARKQPAQRRPLGLELLLVVAVSAAVLVPGIWRYSLVDPWETHYGEVGRMMLQSSDWVHLEWPGASTGGDLKENEGFRSKPVLTPWLIAAGLRAAGVAKNGGYSGEMVASARTMIGERVPFILTAIAGLALMWFALARLVSRRAAWLALLVVGSCPMFCLIARQAIPDMPLCATTMGAIALFALAVEDGDREIDALGQLRIGARQITFDARHLVLGLAGGFVLLQAAYYGYYFITQPRLAVPSPLPWLWLPGLMIVLLAGLWSRAFWVIRSPLLGIGAIISGIRTRRFSSAETYALDRLVIRAVSFPFVVLGRYLMRRPIDDAWAVTDDVADHALAVSPITQMRQVYLIGCYALLGVGVLAKGPPGLSVVGVVGVLHIVLLGKWRAFYEGAFELKRGLLTLIAVALPWHIAMFLKDGIRFIDEYLFTHILSRAAADPDKSLGTFEYYTSQLGHGMWLWAALLPAAFAAGLLRARADTREGRVRAMILVWAIGGFAVFGVVQTKFHHYILPIVPALGILVALFLDDVLARRDRLHPLYAALGAAIVLLVCRDLMHEPDRWIEMFVYRYDRPWPSAEPWSIDPSDGFLGLGLAACAALAICAIGLRRLGVMAIAGVGLAIGVWALQAYMPDAGQHWGMRDAMRAYYRDRTIYGEKLVYYGAGELADDWAGNPGEWTFDTFVPDALQLGQPMTLTIEVKKPEDERVTEAELSLVGSVARIGEHSVTVYVPPNELAKLAPQLARGGAKAPRGRPPVRFVDADRLLAWQLYWRGENFWSGEEVWGQLIENKTSFTNSNNVEFGKYMNDRVRAPLGRRYFVITEGGKITSPRATLPTPRARDSYEVLDTTSNKFALAAFYL